MNNEFKDSVKSFLSVFEQVFDKDWEYTKEQLGIQQQTQEQIDNSRGLEVTYIISPDGTFLNPKVNDETEDWGFRGALLKEYRKLKKIVSEK